MNEKWIPVVSKGQAASYLSTPGYSHLDRLILIQKSLNDIEERLTRIEERLDK